MATTNHYCLNCQTETEVILDYRAGYKTCSRCGLSVKFDDDQVFDEIPVDPLSSPVQENHPISNSNNIVNPTKKGFSIIRGMAETLGVDQTVKDKAYEIYDKVDILKACRGRKINAVAAACLLVACRETGVPLTLKGISIVSGGIQTKDISRAVEAIRKELEVEARTLKPEELVKLFCSKLGLRKQAVKVVGEAVRRMEELDIRRSPKSVLGAVIYIVMRLCNEQMPVKDIAVATEVTEITIRKSYNDISPYVSHLIPSWFATKEDILKIPSP